MTNLIFYTLLVFELILSFSIFFYVSSLLYSSIKGAPFVPSKSSDYKESLLKASLKENQVFLELGAGDSRVTRFAVKNFKVKGIVVEINPMLNLYSKICAKLQNLKNIQFIQADILKNQLPKADFVYLFLMPDMILKLKDKLIKEQKNSIIISHGFVIEGWERFLFDKIKRKTFSTYFYQI